MKGTQFRERVSDHGVVTLEASVDAGKSWEEYPDKILSGRDAARLAVRYFSGSTVKSHAWLVERKPTSLNEREAQAWAGVALATLAMSGWTLTDAWERAL